MVWQSVNLQTPNTADNNQNSVGSLLSSDSAAAAESASAATTISSVAGFSPGPLANSGADAKTLLSNWTGIFSACKILVINPFELTGEQRGIYRYLSFSAASSLLIKKLNDGGDRLTPSVSACFFSLAITADNYNDFAENLEAIASIIPHSSLKQMSQIARHYAVYETEKMIIPSAAKTPYWHESSVDSPIVNKIKNSTCSTLSIASAAAEESPADLLTNLAAKKQQAITRLTNNWSDLSAMLNSNSMWAIKVNGTAVAAANQINSGPEHNSNLCALIAWHGSNESIDPLAEVFGL